MKSLHIPVIIASILLAALKMPASDFDRHFTNATLRIDYIFSGDASHTDISLSSLSSYNGWAGRRHLLDRLPLLGNGRLTATTSIGDTIYRTSFSSLYHEWLDTDEAMATPRAMQNTLLIPMPIDTTYITIELSDQRHDIISSMTHRIIPSDILIRQVNNNNGKSKQRRTKYIQYSGTPAECIDVTICAEGYTEAQYDLFISDAKRTVESIASHQPFTDNIDRFNFIAVFVPSDDSGVSVPRLGQWKSTAYSSHFSTFYSTRYLTTENIFSLHNSLDGLPYEHIIILANTEEYGGGGIYNAYTLTTAHHPRFSPVVVHEFGHSFGGLADEYFYPDDIMNGIYPHDIEPWEPNITTLTDFKSKWETSIMPGTPIPTPDNQPSYTIGVYEGGGYSAKGVYRPAIDCRMRSNDASSFCPVCSNWLESLIDFYVPSEL